MDEIQILRRRINLRKQALPILLDETRAEVAKKNRCDAQLAVLHSIKADLEAKIALDYFDKQLSDLIASTDFLLENLRDAILSK